jgi:hypothetical protein
MRYCSNSTCDTCALHQLSLLAAAYYISTHVCVRLYVTYLALLLPLLLLLLTLKEVVVP